MDWKEHGMNRNRKELWRVKTKVLWNFVIQCDIQARRPTL